VRVLTWHVHGTYLYYLAHAPHEFVVPVKAGRPEGYGGRAPGFPWPDNLREVPADAVRGLQFDAVLFQSRRNYTIDQYELLSEEQRRLPRIYLEHDPPREHPTDTRHVVDDPAVLLVHVTEFNRLMWDSGRTPTTVIEHGVVVPEEARYSGHLARGIVVVNGLARRGRRLGLDLFTTAKQQVPLDLAGMQSSDLGGLGEIGHSDLHGRMAAYRFFFNPIRYTSLGLAVCEAMTIGLPIIGLATTEMAVAIENGVTGFVDTSIDRLIDRMRALLADIELARELGAGARRAAAERFDIRRFARDWDRVITRAAGRRTAGPPAIAVSTGGTA